LTGKLTDDNRTGVTGQSTSVNGKQKSE